MRLFYTNILVAAVACFIATGCEEKPYAIKTKAEQTKPAISKTPAKTAEAGPADKKTVKVDKNHKKPNKQNLAAKPAKDTRPSPKKAIATKKKAKPAARKTTLAKKKSPKKTKPKPATQMAKATRQHPKPQPIKPKVAIRTSAKPRPVPIKPAIAPSTSKEQPRLAKQLKRKNLRLIMDLERAEVNNLRLKRALIESRETTNTLQTEQNRKSIMLEIQKHKIAELNETLAELKGKKNPKPQPAQTADEALQTALELAKYKRRCETLKLQLKLATMNEPAKTQKLLEKLMDLSQKTEQLEKLNRKLSHMVVKHSEQNRTNAKKISQLEKRLTARTSRAATRAGMRNPSHTKRPKPLANTAAECIVPESPTAAQPKISYAPTGRRLAVSKPKAPPARTKPRQSKPIAGEITAIKDGVVLLNIGQKQGMESGMRLIVYRNDKFVGYLRVDEVSLSESAGTLTRRVYDPKIGDKVIDRLE